MATHKELITSGKFDEKFARCLLNYYNYGFKRYADFQQSPKTIHDDWDRLNSVICDYFEWSSWKSRKNVMFASADSQSMDENPFHRVYRFCKYKPLIFPAYYLHTIAALSPSFELREGVASLGLDVDQTDHLQDLIDNQSKLKTSDLLYFYTEKLAFSDSDDKNKNPNNRLDDLSMIGLVDCEQNKGVKGGKGDRRWSLPELTMKQLLDSGSKIDKNFERHLSSMLDFFSKYYLFGEVGMFLLDRIGVERISPFRFKHEYFMQALNDFNIVDLLYAIKNKKWCKVKYSHGTADFSTEILCFPLEIRTSNMHGRQFLFYYEPFRRSYTALRVEFIDSIEYFDDKEIKSILVESEYHKSTESIDADINNAKTSIKHSWGVSTTKQQDNNATKPVEPHLVSLKIAYNPETDYYIANRLKRERRSGRVSVDAGNHCLNFSINVSDEVELRPWIRSFYSRIIECEGMDTDSFSFKTDVRKINDLLLRDGLEQPHTQLGGHNYDRWSIPDTVQTMLGEGDKARRHDLLFNEVFSIYYYIIADVFAQLSSCENGRSFTDDELVTLISETCDKYKLKSGKGTKVLLMNEIRELLLDGQFLRKINKDIEVRVPNSSVFWEKKRVVSYLPVYKCDSDVNLYRDIVPLSKMELRWLKTIVKKNIEDKDNKLYLFMTPKEVDVIRNLINKYAPDLSPVPMDSVVFYDRFHFSENDTSREANVISKLLEGIYTQKTVHIIYHSMKNQVIVGDFRPIIVEFSKRNNRFQLYCQKCESERIYTMNISRIEAVDFNTSVSFDYFAAERDYESFRAGNSKSIEIEFYDVRNIADRILTEFAPWKKRCSYDPITGLYKLTIFYQKQDEVDLIVRLLGYGAYFRIIDKQHPIYKEIQSRVNRQMELNREHQEQQRDTEQGDNR